MRRVGFAILYGIAGYVIGALGGYGLVLLASGNTHDPGLEAAMTAAFVAGPLVGLVSAVVGAVRVGRPAEATGEGRARSGPGAGTP